MRGRYCKAHVCHTGLAGLYARRLAQLSQAGPRAGADDLHPLAYKYPVFPGDGHDVGYGPDGDKVAVPLKQLFCMIFALHRAQKFEGDAAPGKRLVGIRAVFPLRIYNCARGQRLPAFMVIRYYHIHSEGSGVLRLFHRGHAAVDRDDERHAARLKLVNAAFFDSVPVTQPFGNKYIAFKALPVEIIRRHAGRGYTVRVIIPVYGDMFFRRHRFFHARDGLFHALHQHGIKKGETPLSSDLSASSGADMPREARMTATSGLNPPCTRATASSLSYPEICHLPFAITVSPLNKRPAALFAAFRSF
jgi:hypothetical protein